METPEQKREADKHFAAWRDAANAAFEAREVHGPDSPEYAVAEERVGETWELYKKLRPAEQKNWLK